VVASLSDDEGLLHTKRMDPVRWLIAPPSGWETSETGKLGMKVLQ